MQEKLEGGFAEYYSVAVVKKNTLQDVTDLRHLRNKRACFPWVGSLAGWIIPIYTVNQCNSRWFKTQFKSKYHLAATRWRYGSGRLQQSGENSCQLFQQFMRCLLIDQQVQPNWRQLRQVSKFKWRAKKISFSIMLYHNFQTVFSVYWQNPYWALYCRWSLLRIRWCLPLSDGSWRGCVLEAFNSYRDATNYRIQ